MVGTIVGCLAGVVYLLASQALPATVAAVVAIAFGIAITGAFHLDGLADGADAFAGGTTVERRFEILKRFALAPTEPVHLFWSCS